MKPRLNAFGRYLWRHRAQFTVLGTVLLLLPLPLVVQDQAATAGYLLLMMAVFWCTDVFPLGVTGLMPIFFLPLTEIMPLSDVCAQYLRDTAMMFSGAVMVAICIQNVNLHKRVALGILKLVGSDPKWLMLGFMLPTFIISMFICNAATTTMMLPIVEAVLSQLSDADKDPVSDDIEGNNSSSADCTDISVLSVELEKKAVDNSDEVKPDASSGAGDTVVFANPAGVLDGHYVGESEFLETMEPEGSSFDFDESRARHTSDLSGSDEARRDAKAKEFADFGKCMTLAIAYSANVGGVVTLTGTSTNAILKSHLDEIWERHGLGEAPVNYTTWLIYGLPIALLNFAMVYAWLCCFYLGFRSMCGCCTKTKRNPERDQLVKNIIRKEYEQLGPIRYAEVVVGFMFLALILLFFFRSPGFMTGWGDLFAKGYIGDAVTAMLIASLLFIIPDECTFFCKPDDDTEDTKKVATLLNWEVVHRKFPWSIIFLMGGGNALAQACSVSGLSDWIADQLTVFSDLPGWLMVFILCILVALLTEITNNAAACTLLMPIMESMALSLGMNPMYLMMPVAVSCSLAFMLPAATPPNAIAFSFGRIEVLDMVKAGLLLNFLCAAVVTLATETWAYAFFEYDVIPWVNDVSNNVTTLAPKLLFYD